MLCWVQDLLKYEGSNRTKTRPQEDDLVEEHKSRVSIEHVQDSSRVLPFSYPSVVELLPPPLLPSLVHLFMSVYLKNVTN